jgi:alkaline phosphatase D
MPTKISPWRLRGAAALCLAILGVVVPACDDEGPTPSSPVGALDSSFVRPEPLADIPDADLAAGDVPADSPAEEPDTSGVSDASDATDTADAAEASDLDASDLDASDLAPPGAIDLGAARTVAGCEEVTIAATPDVTLSDLSWSYSGYHALALERVGDAGLRFRAPVVNRPTAIRVRLDAQGPTGPEYGRVVVHVRPAESDDGALAAGMAWDCAPFPTGVASGDPTVDSVLLWTRVAADADTELTWELATDPIFDTVVTSGSAVATAARDWTVQVEATGLSAATTYYYRFATPDGATSATGRTRTAPDDDATSARIASMSCASAFSGYFNPYARLAERDDLALVVHLGDYIYDAVDEEEEVRLPAEYPAVPETEAEWRARHRYYLADPDLRAARGAHPWVALWDNHDIARALADAEQRSIEVFRENLPIREVDPEDPRVIWRTVRLGALADLTIVDIYAHHLDDESLLSEAQWTYLEATARASTAAWRIFGNQELTTTMLGPEDFGLGSVSDWDEVPGERERFFALLAERDDNLVLSGDLHFTVAADMVLDPAAEPAYDPATSDRSVGVELLAGSITRGNFDETLCSGLCERPLLNVIENIRGQLLGRNPHFADLELIEHGYAIVDIDAERIEAQMWFSPIREIASAERPGTLLTVERGTNRWLRPE